MTRSMAALALVLAAATPALAQDPSGVWMRDDGNARVRIAPCGDKICATNLWIGDTSQGEEVGDKLVMSLKPKSSDTLSGTAYDAKRNKSYAMTLRVSAKGLRTRGCLLGVVCKSVNWTPAK